MVAFVRNSLVKKDFEADLATFCCYDYGINASKAVQKITTDQKDYRKCSSCVIVYCIVKIYHSVTVTKNVSYYYQDNSGVAKKKAAEVAQKKEQ